MSRIDLGSSSEPSRRCPRSAGRGRTDRTRRRATPTSLRLDLSTARARSRTAAITRRVTSTSEAGSSRGTPSPAPYGRFRRRRRWLGAWPGLSTTPLVASPAGSRGAASQESQPGPLEGPLSLSAVPPAVGPDRARHHHGTGQLLAARAQRVVDTEPVTTAADAAPRLCPSQPAESLSACLG